MAIRWSTACGQAFYLVFWGVSVVVVELQQKVRADFAF